MPAVVSAPRPEPVGIAGKVAGALSGLATIVVAVGWISAADASATVDAAVAVVSAVATLVSIAAPIVTSLRARKLVTPVASPAVELPGGRVVPAELVPVG